MQEPHLFEYAVIRVVPHVERGEFLNVGVILYCPSERFLQCVTEIDEERLKVLCEDMDFHELRKHIQSFERICAGARDSGRIGQLTMPERFRWLTAARSTIVQTSSVHPGLCTNAREKLASLYQQLVVKPKPAC
ncbi:MAG TPA: DUF3037 domain-containing protein [Chryseosolibacter sp.]|nr:DUF3037 domain-containing protein [Chryseosolibacter sp.]